LGVLDTFNRPTTVNLNLGAPAGVAWIRQLLGSGRIAVFDVNPPGGINAGVAQDLLMPGSAYWNGSNAGPVLSNRQAAAFTSPARQPATPALMLKARAPPTQGLQQNFVRVFYTTPEAGRSRSRQANGGRPT